MSAFRINLTWKKTKIKDREKVQGSNIINKAELRGRKGKQKRIHIASQKSETSIENQNLLHWLLTSVLRNVNYLWSLKTVISHVNNPGVIHTEKTFIHGNSIKLPLG